MARNEMYGRDEPWALFYRDGLSLGEIAGRLGGSVYDYSPWLAAPIIRAAMDGAENASARAERLEEALDESLRQIRLLAEAGVERLKDHGIGADPAENTYGPIIENIRAMTKRRPEPGGEA